MGRQGLMDDAGYNEEIYIGNCEKCIHGVRYYDEGRDEYYIGACKHFLKHKECLEEYTIEEDE